jgi:hypothetical protein
MEVLSSLTEAEVESEVKRSTRKAIVRIIARAIDGSDSIFF